PQAPQIALRDHRDDQRNSVTSTTDVTPLCRLSCFVTILSSGQYQSVTVETISGMGTTMPLNDACTESMVRVYWMGQHCSSPAAVLIACGSPARFTPVCTPMGPVWAALRATLIWNFISGKVWPTRVTGWS